MATQIPKPPVVMNLPEAPTRKTARPDFVVMADNFVKAQQPWGQRVNEVAEWMRGIGALVLQYANEGEDWHTQTKREAENAESAARRAAQSSLLADTAKIEAEQSKVAAQVAAAAAAAGAGLPSLDGNGGKVLTIRKQEDGVEWSPFGLVAVEVTSHNIPDQMLPNVTRQLSFEGKPYLVGATISHFVFNIDGLDNKVKATNNKATFSYTNNHVEGTSSRWTLVAIDNLGNSSIESSGIVEFTSEAEYIKTPVITSPKNGAINIKDGLVIEWRPMEVHGGSDTHTGTTVRITDGDGAIVHEKKIGTGLSYLVPLGVLQGGRKKYKVDIKFHGDRLGESPWSDSIGFTTAVRLSAIYGVALVAEGGNGGTLVHLDKSGNVVDLNKSDFDAHPVWAGITDVRLDSQYMVKIPKFYVKYEERIVPPAVSPVPCWYISDELVDGFELYPAFYNEGVEIDQIYIGKYQASLASGKLRSVPGVLPTVDRSITQFKSDAEARNVSGVTGFMLWSLYQWSAIQWLYLVENATFNSQEKTGQGRVNASSAANVDAADVAQATYRGMVGLWGNVHQWMDGLKQINKQFHVWDMRGNKNFINTQTRRDEVDGTIYPDKFLETTVSGIDFSMLFIGTSGKTSNSNATVPDYQYATTSTEDRFPRVGGRWSDGTGAGLWFVYVNISSTYTHSYIGGRLAKI